MSFSLLSVTIIGISAAIIYKEIRKGYKHGLLRSLINLATLIFCAVFSSVISTLLASLIGDILHDVLTERGFFDSLVAPLTLLVGVTEMLAKMLLSVLLYLPVFYTLKAFVSRPIRIFCSLLAKKWSLRRRKNSPPEYLSEEAPFYVIHDKKIGAAVGALAGLVLAIIVFMPLTGLLNSTTETLEVVQEFVEIPALEEAEWAVLVDKYSHDASGTVLQACGGRGLYNLTARTTIHGHTTYLNKEIDVIKSLNVKQLLEELEDSGELGVDNIQMVEKLVDGLDESLSMKLLMTEFLSEASTSWMGYQSYMGIERPNLAETRAVEGFFDSILYVCSTTTIETYDADVRTVVALIKIFGENQEAFDSSDYNVIMQTFVDDGLLYRIEEELYKNPHMGLVHLSIDDLIMDMIADELDSGKYSLASKDILYRGIASVMNDARGLTGSAQTTTIGSGVGEHFEKQGVYLPETLENRIGEILVSNVSGADSGQLTETDIANFFAGYTKTTEQQ